MSGNSRVVRPLASTTEVAKILLRLKARLRWSGSQVVFTVLVDIVGVIAAFGLAVGIWYIRSFDNAGALLSVGGFGLALLWFVVPLLFGAELVIDVANFSHIPIRRPTLISGLIAVAVLGVGPAVTIIIVFGSVTHAGSLAAAGVLLLAALVFIINVLLVGRAASSVMALLRKGRRTKELSTWLGLAAGLAIAPVINNQAVVVAWVNSHAESVRPVTRWVPLGWGAETIALASEGKLLPAFIWLLATLGFSAVLSVIWVAALDRLVVTTEYNKAVEVGSPLLPRWMKVLPVSVTTVGFAKATRSFRRNNYEIMDSILFPLIMCVSFITPGLSSLSSLTGPEVLFSGAAAGLLLSLMGLNLLGGEGASFAVHALVVDDFTSLIRGKAWSRVAVVGLLLGCLTVGLSFLSGDWEYLPAGFLVGVACCICGAGVGAIISVRTPHRVGPVKKGSTKASRGQNGCMPMVTLAIGSLVPGLLATPVIVGVIVTGLYVSPYVAAVVGVVGCGYSYIVFNLLTKRAGAWANSHIPEIHAELTKGL